MGSVCVVFEGEAMVRHQLADKIADLQAEVARYFALVGDLQGMVADSRAAVARSRKILMGHSSPSLVRQNGQALAEANGPGGQSQRGQEAGKTRTPRKGDEAILNDDGWQRKAVIIEVLSESQVLVRVMKGPLAGEEIEAEFLNDAMDQAPALPATRDRKRAKLFVVGGNASGHSG
jgi:hypothetical protein